MGDKLSYVNSATDDSGYVHVNIYKQVPKDPQNIFIDYEIKLPEKPLKDEYNPANMIAIGGGGMTDWKDHNGPGALLTASYPNNTNDGWIVSSKAHGKDDYHKLTAYVIGLGIEYKDGSKHIPLARHQLYRNIKVITNERKTPVTDQPASVFAKCPYVKDFANNQINGSDLLMVGGGFQIEWENEGTLATASFPGDNEVGWEAHCKPHGWWCNANLTSYLICINQHLYFIDTDYSADPTGNIVKKPFYIGQLENTRNIKNGKASSGSDFPEETATLTSGYAITGGGGNALYTEKGQLLWELRPNIIKSSPSAKPKQSFTTSSKAHLESDPGKIDAYVLGIRLHVPILK